MPKERDKIIVDRVEKTIVKIKELAKKLQPRFLILSSEGFIDYNEDDIQKTIDALDLEFTDIYCIVYVRCPPDYYLSLVQQQIKGSHKILNPITFRRNVVSPLTKWRSIVGETNFFGDIFHEKILPQGDVVADFKEKIIEITEAQIEFNEYSVQNESLSAEQMILLQTFRYDFLQKYDGQFIPASSRLINFFSDLNQLKHPGKKPKLRSEITETILANNREDILGVDDLFGGNAFSDLSGLKECPLAVTEAKIPVEKIKDILCAYNKEYYDLLKNILPEYNQDIKSACQEFLSVFDESREVRAIAAQTYLNYLKSNGYFSVDQLEKVEKINIEYDDNALFDLLKTRH